MIAYEKGVCSASFEGKYALENQHSETICPFWKDELSSFWFVNEQLKQ